MPPSTEERIIRLVVNTTKICEDGRLQLNVSNEICVVDLSEDLDTVKRQLSVQVGFDVESLSLFTFNAGHIIAISAIKSHHVLRDQDVVLAFRKGDGRLMASGDANESTAIASPSPSSRIDYNQKTSTACLLNGNPPALEAAFAETSAMDESLTTHDDALQTSSPFGTIGNIVRKTVGWFGHLLRGGMGISTSIDASMKTNLAPARTMVVTDIARISRDQNNGHCVHQHSNDAHAMCPLQLLASVAEAPNDKYLKGSCKYEARERYCQNVYRQGQYGAEYESMEVDKLDAVAVKKMKDCDNGTSQTSGASEILDDDSDVGENDIRDSKCKYESRPMSKSARGNRQKHTGRSHSRYHRLGIHPKNKMKKLLTDEQRLELEGMEFNLDDFERFLVKEAGRAANNVPNLVNKINLMVKGEAISYKYWKGDQAAFYAEPPIEDMSANAYMIRNDVFHHEDIYGKDRSNGWLLKIPLSKFQTYQLHCYRNRKKILSSRQSKPQSRKRSEQANQANHGTAIEASSQRKYGINTRVRKNFGPYGYWEGKVFSVDTSTGKYGVRFTDGEERYFMESEIDKFVDLYRKRHHSQQSKLDDSASSSSFGGHDESEEEEEDSDESPTKKQKIVTRWKDPLMTDKQRNKLIGIPIDIDGFKKFLQKEGICEETIGRVVTKVSMLLSGQGISYRGWPEDIVFRPRINDLSADFYKLQEDAVEFETKHGRDSSKGWLVRHPLQKLEKYQEYFYKTKLSKYKNSPNKPIRHRLLLTP